MDEILRKAAETMGMPPALTERSARARAEKEGTTVEAVLAEWAGESAAAPASEPPPASEPTEPAATTPPADTSTGTGPTEVTTDYLVALAAEAKRMPEKLVRSSAEARARNSGTDLDVVLAAWAGVDLDELITTAEAGEPLPPVSTPAPEEPTAPTPPPEPEPAEAPPVAAAAAGAVAMSVDELLEQAAAAKGMPASIAKRSAQARATSEGVSLETVLAEWAGVDPGAAPADAPSATEPAPADPAPAPAAAAGAVAMSVDELLEQAAAAKGMPASIAKRSAQARATSEGVSLETVLAEWAGVDPADVGSGVPAAAAAPAAAPATPAPPPEPDQTPSDDVEVIPPTEPETDDESPDVDDAPATAARSGYPAWLAAAFVIIPLLAVAYILVAPNGPDCGTAGQLNIDPATGLAVNCDGSEYGGSSVDFFSMGSGIYSQCSACHGSDGGGGTGPAFTGGAVLATFPEGSCSDHIQWVLLGTSGWPEDTYGANQKPVGGGGVMPGFPNLTEEELASVALYERVAFGGQALEDAEVDCGLTTEDGAEPADGESGDGSGEDGTDEMVDAAGG